MSDTIEETKPEVEESEETGVEEKPEQEWTPPSKEDFEKVRKTAEARKGDVAKLRKELGELKAKLGSQESDETKQAAKAEQDRELKTKRIAGVSALVSEGLSKDQAKKLVRLLDMSEVELDDDGDGDFSDAIDDLKSAFPELFATKRPARPAVSTKNRGDGGGNASSGNPQLDGMLKTLGLK
jgi:hypothetical protein